MTRKSGPLSWGEEAELLTLEANDEVRPEWMVSREEVEDYFDLIRPRQILVTGSRDWDDLKSVRMALRKAVQYTEKNLEVLTLLHSGAVGAEKMTRIEAEEMGFNTQLIFANSSRHSKDCLDEESDLYCWKGRSGCTDAIRRRDLEMFNSKSLVLIAFVRSEYPEPNSLLDLWLKEGRATILCQQSTPDEPVIGKTLNTHSWEDRD